jgi:hypothetical protein
MMTEKAYVAAYQSLIAQYFDNQASMDEHLNAVQALKDEYLGSRPGGTELPTVP